MHQVVTAIDGIKKKLQDIPGIVYVGVGGSEDGNSSILDECIAFCRRQADRQTDSRRGTTPAA